MSKYLKFKNLKPAIVLGSITTVMTAILVVTTNLLPDTSGVMTDKLLAVCVSLMGEGEFTIREDLEKPEGIDKIISKNDGGLAFEVTASGYNQNSINVLVAMNDDGTVKGIAPVSISDSPGYGDKVENDADFFAGFGGKDDFADVEGVSGATRTSRGVKKAAEIAVEAYKSIPIHEWRLGGSNE